MSTGGVRLRRKLAQERAQHHDRLLTVPVHLRRHRRPTVQRTILLLHGRHQEHGARMQVSSVMRVLGPLSWPQFQPRSRIAMQLRVYDHFEPLLT